MENYKQVYDWCVFNYLEKNINVYAFLFDGEVNDGEMIATNLLDLTIREILIILKNKNAVYYVAIQDDKKDEEKI